jgi:hypothetical protein
LDKLKFKLARENLHVQMLFKRPLFKWQEAAIRFFEFVYDALGVRLNIQPSEFSINPTHSYGDARARFSIYGGNTSITLMPDKLSFDFPGLLSSDLPLVYEIMGVIHDKFPNVFAEVEQGRIEVQDYAHLDLGTVEAAKTVLDRYRIDSIETSFSPASVLNTPSLKFTVLADDGSWQSELMVDQSLLITSGLFVSCRMVFHKLAPSFLEKLTAVQDVEARCLAAVGLESENAA